MVVILSMTKLYNDMFHDLIGSDSAQLSQFGEYAQLSDFSQKHDRK